MATIDIYQSQASVDRARVDLIAHTVDGSTPNLLIAAAAMPSITDSSSVGT